MLLSIIIPTKNEANFLPILLASIQKQTFKDYEIIVADNHSEDGTEKIAREFGARVVTGGLPGPGRNAGACEAKGEWLLFLDADTKLLDVDFLTEALQEIERRHLSVAVPRTVTQGNVLDRIFFHYWNWFVFATQLTRDKLGGGWCIFARKEIHDEIGGFNAKIRLGEDSDYVRRAALLGRFRMLLTARIQTSPRRLKKEGYLKVALQSLGSAIYILLHGKIDETNKFNYEFDIYKENK